MKKLTLTLTIITLITYTVNAQNLKMKLNPEKESKAALIEIKQDTLIRVYIDGKKYDADILDIIDPDKIESINVLKGEYALERYNSPKVLEITTKANISETVSVVKAGAAVNKSKAIKITANHGLIEIDNKSIGDNPLVVIDGEIKSQDDFKEIKPEDIKSVTILKDKSATALYGKAGENGVVMIETRNAKKTKKKD